MSSSKHRFIPSESDLPFMTRISPSDTKLTAKSLVTDITSHAATLSTTPQGRRALFYLILPRSRRHFTPAQINTLAETDAIRAKTSKKDEDVRRAEVRKAGSEELIAFVEENGDVTARDTGGCLVVVDIMLYAEGGGYLSKSVYSHRGLTSWISR